MICLPFYINYPIILAQDLTAKIFFVKTLCKNHLAEAHLSAHYGHHSLPHSLLTHSSLLPSMRPANVMNEYIPNSPHAHADPRTITAKEMAQQTQQYIRRARRQYNRAGGFEDDEEFGADKLPPERVTK